MRAALGTVLVVLFATLSGCSSLVYQPSKFKYFILDPKRVIFEDIWVRSQDGTKLHGWYFRAQHLTEHPNEKDAPPPLAFDRDQVKGLVLQFHGNGENMTTHFASVIWFVNEGYDLITWDYRGYGESAGVPDQKGLFEDSLSMMEYATAKQTPLVLVGQSLGGAVLMRAFSEFKKRDQVKAVIIDSSFYSYQAIATDILSRWWLSWPFQWLGKAWISDQYTPENVIAQISPTPLLVMHGDRDAVVPFKMGEEIFRRAREPKKFLKIENGAHIDAWVSPIHGDYYKKAVLKFLDGI